MQGCNMLVTAFVVALAAVEASPFPIVSPYARTVHLPDWADLTGMDADSLWAHNGNTHNHADASPSPTFASHFKQTFESAISTSKVLAMMYSNNTAKLAATYPEPITEYGYNLTQAIFQGAATGYLDINGVCREQANQVYQNLFAALPACKKTGQTKKFPFYNKTCVVYSASFPNPSAPGKKTNISYCIDIDDADGPRPVNFLSSGYAVLLPGTPPSDYRSEIDFLTYEPNSPDIHEHISIPAQCTRPAPLCKPAAEGAVVNLTLFVAHPKNHTGELHNQDVGDFDGDTTFVCLYAATTGPSALDPDYNAVSQVVVEVDTRYGAYSLCNDYPGICFGSEEYAVGREVALGVDTLGGQCDYGTKAIKDLGLWFSLPKGGECKSGQHVTPATGPPGCSWRLVEIVKTVALSCVVTDRGMKDACVADKIHPPWAKAKAVFEGVFASEDPTKGGCPHWD